MDDRLSRSIRFVTWIIDPAVDGPATMTEVGVGLDHELG